MDAELIAIEAEALYGILDQLDYFQLLQVSENATTGEIKAAYRRQSKIFHPDRFFRHEEAELERRVLEIFKRLTEAYTVLRDERTRHRYREGLKGPDRAERIRWRVEDGREERKTVEEEIGRTPNGRKLYGAAMADWKAGRLEAAERSLRMALLYEADNALFRQKLAEVSALLDAASKAKAGK